jgi:hypothetical protein
MLFNFFKKYYNVLIYLFIYLFFLGFLNILFFNEELIICIALIIYFTAIISILRKFILIYFYTESELLYFLFYIVNYLNIIYIKEVLYLLSHVYNYQSKQKNIRTYFIFKLFLEKFKLLCFYYIFKIKKFNDRFNYNYNYNLSSFIDLIDSQYIDYIENFNKFFPKKKFNLRYILVITNRFRSKMSLIASPFTSSNYVS